MEPAPVHPVAEPVARGFTLVELLVVIAIIAILSVVVLSGQSTFNRSLVLTNTAYTVAFSARQAQTFGLTSRTFGAVRNAGYGLRFLAATPTSYLFFADTNNALPAPAQCPLGTAGTPTAKPGNCRYDAGGDGLVQTYALTRGFSFVRFCGRRLSDNVQECSDSAPFVQALDVVYTRPNPRGTLVGLLPGGPISVYRCAEVVVRDPNSLATRTIRFTQLGEVSTNQVCP